MQPSSVTVIKDSAGRQHGQITFNRRAKDTSVAELLELAYAENRVLGG